MKRTYEATGVKREEGEYQSVLEKRHSQCLKMPIAERRDGLHSDHGKLLVYMQDSYRLSPWAMIAIAHTGA